MGVVRAPSRTRDTLSEGEQRPPPTRVAAAAEREELAAKIVRQPGGEQDGSARARRALASYHDVAGNTERSELREMLGFDAYA